MAINDKTIPTIALSSAMRRKRRAMAIASARWSSRFVVSTMSAALEFVVDPRAPIATPTVAAASAGASLTPSPTITVIVRSCSARTCATFSVGVRWAYTASSPSTAPISSAGASRSPVNITANWSSPADRSRRSAACVVRLAAAGPSAGSRRSASRRG